MIRNMYGMIFSAAPGDSPNLPGQRHRFARSQSRPPELSERARHMPVTAEITEARPQGRAPGGVARPRGYAGWVNVSPRIDRPARVLRAFTRCPRENTMSRGDPDRVGRHHAGPHGGHRTLQRWPPAGGPRRPRPGGPRHRIAQFPAPPSTTSAWMMARWCCCYPCRWLQTVIDAPMRAELVAAVLAWVPAARRR